MLNELQQSKQAVFLEKKNGLVMICVSGNKNDRNFSGH